MKGYAALLLVALTFCALVSAYKNEDLVDQVNSESSTWFAAHNAFFADKSLDDVKSMLGYKKTGVLSLPVVTPLADVPDNFTASEQWPGCPSTSLIWNQAECGSCWAFGAVESFTDRYCIINSQTTNPLFSPQYMVACDNAADGCQGGEASLAWEFIRSSGLPTNTCQPYTIPTCPPAQQPCLNFKPTPNCVRDRCTTGESWSVVKASSIYSVSGASGGAHMQTELQTNGPIEACFNVYEDFLSYKSGVYIHKSGQLLGGHCVRIVGWGEENNLPYWLVANSWTSYWGDDGYFKILRGKDECGIESDVVAGVPNSN